MDVAELMAGHHEGMNQTCLTCRRASSAFLKMLADAHARGGGTTIGAILRGRRSAQG